MIAVGAASGLVGMIVGGMLGLTWNLSVEQPLPQPSSTELSRQIQSLSAYLKEELTKLHRDTESLAPSLPRPGEQVPTGEPDQGSEERTRVLAPIETRLEALDSRIQELGQAISQAGGNRAFEARPKNIDALKDATTLLAQNGSRDQYGKWVVDGQQYEAFMTEHFGRTPAEIVARYGMADDGSNSEEWIYYIQVRNHATGAKEISLHFLFEGGVVTSARFVQ